MSYAEKSKGKHTGRWVCDAEYKHADGSRTRWHKAFATKQEAAGAEAYYRATGNIPPHIATGPARDTFASVAERFKTKHPKWFAAHDGKTNAQRFEFAVAHLGKLPVNAIRTRELEDFVEKVEARCGRGGQPPANATVNRYLDAVSKVLTYAHKLDLIQGTPSFPRRDNDDGEKRDALSWAQEDAICHMLESRGAGVDAFLIRVLCGTGMRAGELDAITASQIHTPEQRENSGVALRGEQTKNGHPRWVPLVPEAAKKLREIIVHGRRTMQHNLYESMKRAVKALGENPKISPHWCRHTFNTRANDATHAHLQVQQILGHLDGSMSQLYYHPDKAKLFEVAEKVQNRLGENPNKSTIVRLNRDEKTA